MACLEMLARHHNVPFRRDVIERAATDNLRGRSQTSLELIGSLSTVMGFTGTLSIYRRGSWAVHHFRRLDGLWISRQLSMTFHPRA